MKTITLHIDQHRNQEVVCFIFKKDYLLIEILKTKLKANWSITKKYWYLPRSHFNIGQTLDAFKDIA